MSTAGVFAVSRGVFDHAAFANEAFTEREAWIWMIGEAAWKARRVRVGSAVIDLKRGQLAVSTRFAASRWQWSEARVRRFLKRLAADAMVTTQTDAHATRITICNYDEYQKVSLPSDAAATQERRTTDAPATQERRKQEDREYRENIKEEEDTDVSSPPPATEPAPVKRTRRSKAEMSAVDADFAALAGAYPRRKGNNPLKPARAKFDTLVRRGVAPATMIAGARAFAAQCVTDGKAGTPYVPMLATWLNGESWQQIETLPLTDPPPPIVPPGARSPEEIRAEVLAKMEARRAAEQQQQPTRENRGDEVQAISDRGAALHRGHAVGGDEPVRRHH